MDHPYERHVITRYLANAIEQLGYRRKLAPVVFGWLIDQGDLLEAKLVTEACRKIEAHADENGRQHLMHNPGLTGIGDRQINRGEWNRIAVNVQKSARLTQGEKISDLEHNLRISSKEFQLDDLDAGIIGILVRYHYFSEFENLYDAMRSARSTDMIGLIGALLGVKRRKISERLSETGRLWATGLVRMALSD